MQQPHKNALVRNYYIRIPRLLQSIRAKSLPGAGYQRRANNLFRQLFLVADGNTVVIQQMLDLGHRVDDAGYAHIMVDGSDEISGVLRQINIKVPGALQQLRLAVGEVGAQHSLDDAVIVGFVELIQTGSEQREGSVGDDAGGAVGPADG